jgi:uncharacterized coiled-coil DUF342 family protein
MDIISFLSKEAPMAGMIAVIGGIVLKIIEKKITNPTDEINSSIALRQELRDELDSVVERLGQLQDEVNEWREKYYSQVELTAQLKLEIAVLREKLEGKLMDMENGCR